MPVAVAADDPSATREPGGAPRPLLYLPRSAQHHPVLGDFPALMALIDPRVDRRATEMGGRGIIAWVEARWLEPPNHRMLVVRERELDRSAGGLHIPDSAREKMCAGWVLSAGPLVGAELGSRPPGPIHYGPEEVIGKKVVFGLHALSSLLLSDRDQVYNSAFGFLTDADVWCFDQSGDLTRQEG